jgi:hypothetical protein
MRQAHPSKMKSRPDLRTAFLFPSLTLSDQYAPCITVKVLPAMVNVPVQELRV